MTLRTQRYSQHLDELGARYVEWRGARVVASFGDPVAEYHAVRDAVGIADRSERATLVMGGDDVVTWLQGLFTNDVFALADPGAGQLTCAVGGTGRLFSDARLLHIQDLILADIEPGVLTESLLPHLQRHIIMEKVKLADRSAATARLGVYGKPAAGLLGRVAKTAEHLMDLDDFCGTYGELANQDVVIQRIALTGEPGFEISCDRESALQVWQAITGAEPAAVPIGNDALEMLRIEAGIPRFGVELNEKVIPLEAGLDHTISFTKGCYLGQEIIARLDTLGTPARLLRMLLLDADAQCGPGASVQADGKKVGEVVSVSPSPKMGQTIALAYIKRSHYELGTTVEVEDVGASVVQALGVL